MYSKHTGSIKILNDRNFTGATLLTAMVGPEYAEKYYGSYNKTTGALTIDGVSLGHAVVKACRKAGMYNPDRLRGSGVWLDDNGKLVVCSELVFAGKGGERIDPVGRYIYMRARDLLLFPDTPVATEKDARDVLDFFKTCSFQTQAGALLALGWLYSCYTCGANKWRPGLFLTGPSGSGKSVVLYVLKSLLGQAADFKKSASVAAIRRGNKRNTLGLILDETESNTTADAARIEGILQLARLSTDGGTDEKCSQTNDIDVFEMQFQVVMAAIKKPRMEPADVSRFLTLEMASHQHGGAVSPLVHDPEAKTHPEIEPLGRRLYSRAVKTWDSSVENLRVVKNGIRRISRFSRSVNTLAPLISGAWSALHNEVLTDKTIDAWLSNFDLETEIERIETAMSDEGIFTHIASSVVRIDDGTSCTIAELWSNNDPASVRELSKRGIKIKDEKICIFDTNAGFIGLMKGTQWERDARTALFRLPFAAKKMSDYPIVYAHGMPSSRYIAIERYPDEWRKAQADKKSTAAIAKPKA